MSEDDELELDPTTLDQGTLAILTYQEVRNARRDLRGLTKRVGALERWRWIITGAGIGISTLLGFLHVQVRDILSRVKL